MKICVQVKIEGRVQGVFFRQSTSEMAEDLGLSGWVRNCPDGTVEALFEGEPDLVAKAVEWCHHGPQAALVTAVEQQLRDQCEGISGFRIKY